VTEATGDRVTWSYDPTYQLTNERRSGANSYNITYMYDLTGNRTFMIDGGARTTYTVNAGNQLVTAKAAGGTTSYSFDANGNLILTNAPGGRTSNAWDVSNRLTQVILPSGIRNSFQYAGDGKRVMKQDSTGTTKSVWDLENVLEETDGSNVTQVIYTMGLSQYGELISQRRGGATNFFSFDGLGSTGQLTDINGTVTDSYLYQAFGSAASSAGTTANSYRFVGRQGYYLDNDLSTYWLRARMYNPATGRFISRDPIGLLSSETNLYRYAGNSPQTAVDPSGYIRVINKGQTPGSCQCGIGKISLCGVQFSFRLSKTAGILTGDDDGYIVQQVKLECDVGPCRGKKVKQSDTYYEAFFVKRTNYTSEYKPGIARRDIAEYTCGLKTCGKFIQEGQIKFYSKEDTGNLGDNPDDKRPIEEGWERNKQFKCNVRSGLLFATGDEPGFWKDGDGQDGIANRYFELNWNCCPNQSCGPPLNKKKK
jgi:RHS repeat-associated protein